MKKLLILTVMATLLAACGHNIPKNFSESDELPNIYPDYIDVTIPINIAPFTFEMDDKADDMVARFTVGNEEVICGGGKIQPDANDWRRLTDSAKGKAIKVLSMKMRK